MKDRVGFNLKVSFIWGFRDGEGGRTSKSAANQGLGDLSPWKGQRGEDRRIFKESSPGGSIVKAFYGGRTGLGGITMGGAGAGSLLGLFAKILRRETGGIILFGGWAVVRGGRKRYDPLVF